MLQRLCRTKNQRDFRLWARFLSDKSKDEDPTIDDSKQLKTEKKASDATDKIQELLKMMMTEPKTSESEYRAKFATAPIVPRRRKQNDETEVTVEKIEESLTKAAGDVAQAIGGDTKQTEAELLSKVLGKITQTSTSLSDLLMGMKVDKSKDTDDVIPKTRGQQVKRLVDKSLVQTQTRYQQRKVRQQEQTRQPRQSLPQATQLNIFSGKPLGIFKPQVPNYGTKLDVWDDLKNREVILATTQPPSNYFQKMILWTEQGKVWKFPINNEQGLEDENDVHFTEHIFLDTHLEGWCPKKGPVRHFMELVCVGLSKNAFYTAKEKKDHIMWYKDYFENKKALLSEIGAWDIKTNEQVTT